MVILGQPVTVMPSNGVHPHRLAIQALLYVPTRNIEATGMQRSESEVNLYCRKVLIQPKAKNLFPEWLRFLRGAVDSEDLPLNISRETMQDSSLMQKLNKVLTSRVIKFLTIYLGPALIALMWPTLLRKLVRVAKEQRVTTISDFIASRYGKSAPLGMLVATLVVCGMIPYIGIHPVDLMRWVTGLDYTHVAALHGTQGKRDVMGETESQASVLLRLANGGSATARLDSLRPSTASAPPT